MMVHRGLGSAKVQVMQDVDVRDCSVKYSVRLANCNAPRGEEERETVCDADAMLLKRFQVEFRTSFIIV